MVAGIAQTHKRQSAASMTLEERLNSVVIRLMEGSITDEEGSKLFDEVLGPDLLKGKAHMYDQIRAVGARNVREQQWAGAVEAYTSAILLSSSNEQRSTNYNNRALCLGKQEKYRTAISDCLKAIGYNARWVKPYIRLSMNLEAVGCYEEAMTPLNRALELCDVSPSDVSSIKAEIEKANERARQRRLKDRYNISYNRFANLGEDITDDSFGNPNPGTTNPNGISPDMIEFNEDLTEEQRAQLEAQITGDYSKLQDEGPSLQALETPINTQSVTDILISALGSGFANNNGKDHSDNVSTHDLQVKQVVEQTNVDPRALTVVSRVGYYLYELSVEQRARCLMTSSMFNEVMKIYNTFFLNRMSDGDCEISGKTMVLEGDSGIIPALAYDLDPSTTIFSSYGSSVADRLLSSALGIAKSIIRPLASIRTQDQMAQLLSLANGNSDTAVAEATGETGASVPLDHPAMSVGRNLLFSVDQHTNLIIDPSTIDGYFFSPRCPINAIQKALTIFGDTINVVPNVISVQMRLCYVKNPVDGNNPERMWSNLPEPVNECVWQRLSYSTEAINIYDFETHFNDGKWVVSKPDFSLNISNEKVKLLLEGLEVCNGILFSVTIGKDDVLLDTFQNYKECASRQQVHSRDHMSPYVMMLNDSFEVSKLNRITVELSNEFCLLGIKAHVEQDDTANLEDELIDDTCRSGPIVTEVIETATHGALKTITNCGTAINKAGPQWNMPLDYYEPSWSPSEIDQMFVQSIQNFVGTSPASEPTVVQYLSQSIPISEIERTIGAILVRPFGKLSGHFGRERSLLFNKSVNLSLISNSKRLELVKAVTEPTPSAVGDSWERGNGDTDPSDHSSGLTTEEEQKALNWFRTRVCTTNASNQLMSSSNFEVNDGLSQSSQIANAQNYVVYGLPYLATEWYDPLEFIRNQRIRPKMMPTSVVVRACVVSIRNNSIQNRCLNALMNDRRVIEFDTNPFTINIVSEVKDMCVVSAARVKREHYTASFEITETSPDNEIQYYLMYWSEFGLGKTAVFSHCPRTIDPERTAEKRALSNGVLEVPIVRFQRPLQMLIPLDNAQPIFAPANPGEGNISEVPMEGTTPRLDIVAYIDPQNGSFVTPSRECTSLSLSSASTGSASNNTNIHSVPLGKITKEFASGRDQLSMKLIEHMLMSSEVVTAYRKAILLLSHAKGCDGESMNNLLFCTMADEPQL